MSTITPSRPRVRVFRVGPEYALLVVLCQNVLVGPMMGDDDVDDVGDDVLSCHGRYYCLGRVRRGCLPPAACLPRGQRPQGVVPQQAEQGEDV